MADQRNPGRRLLGPAALAAAGYAVLQAGPGISGLGPVRGAFFPLLAGQGLPGHVALTFDDGPDPRWTPGFLRALSARAVRATFFMLGSQVSASPRLAAEVAEAGHEIGVHGWEHRYLPLRHPGTTYDDLARTVDIIAERTGTRPWLFRPPYGVLSAAALVAARRLGLTTVLWNCWGREWTPDSTPESVYGTLLRGLDDGATVLLHDSEVTSPEGSSQAALGALPLLLGECARRDLRVGPLSEHGPWWRPQRAGRAAAAKRRQRGPDSQAAVFAAARVTPGRTPAADRQA